MKLCHHCGGDIADTAVFCEHCGEQQDRQADMTAATDMAAPTPPVKRKKKWVTWLVIGIVATVVIGIAASVVLSIAVFRMRDMYTNSLIGDASMQEELSEMQEDLFEEEYSVDEPGEDKADGNTVSVPAVEAGDGRYTKGEITDGWYVNPWANLCFDTRGDWVQAGEDDYSLFDDDPRTECGLILNDVYTGKQITICFERLDGINALISEEEYLDIVTADVEEQYTEELDFPCKVSEYSDTTIADKPFKTVKITFDGTTVVEVIHVYKYDNYMMYIQIVAQNLFDATDVVDQVLPLQ